MFVVVRSQLTCFLHQDPLNQSRAALRVLESQLSCLLLGILWSNRVLSTQVFSIKHYNLVRISEWEWGGPWCGIGLDKNPPHWANIPRNIESLILTLIVIRNCSGQLLVVTLYYKSVTNHDDWCHAVSLPVTRDKWTDAMTKTLSYQERYIYCRNTS